MPTPERSPSSPITARTPRARRLLPRTLTSFTFPTRAKPNPSPANSSSTACPTIFGPCPGASWKASLTPAPGRPWAVAASLVADARLLYHRSQEDLDRFNGLQARIAELTRPDKRAAMVERSLEEFKNTLFQLGQMRLAAAAGDNAGLYAASWQFANSILNGLALLNQTYFTKGWGANLTQALEMPQKPADLADRINGILLSQDATRILEQAEELALDVRRILRAAQMSPGQPADARQVFKDFYPFVFEYRNKVLAACELGDASGGGLCRVSVAGGDQPADEPGRCGRLSRAISIYSAKPARVTRRRASPICWSRRHAARSWHWPSECISWTKPFACGLIVTASTSTL